MKDQGVSLAQAGAVLGISRAHVCLYVNGHKPINLKRAKRLARFLGLEMAEAWLPEHIAQAPGRPRLVRP